MKKEIAKLREPFDNKVYAIPYAGDLFEKQANILLSKVEAKLAKELLEIVDLAVSKREKEIVEMIEKYGVEMQGGNPLPTVQLAVIKDILSLITKNKIIN